MPRTTLDTRLVSLLGNVMTMRRFIDMLIDRAGYSESKEMGDRLLLIDTKHNHEYSFKRRDEQKYILQKLGVE